MTRVIDIRAEMPGGTSRRNTNAIRYIVRHHSATVNGDARSFARYHTQTLGWRTSGYHEVILRDGTVQICYDPAVITNGVGNHNANTYHICVVGNGNFTAAQEKAWQQRALYNIDRFGLSVINVKGHREFAGHASNICPGIDMRLVRERLEVTANKGGGDVMSDELYKPNPTLKNATSVVLNRFANADVHGDKAISSDWRTKLINDELTQDEAIGLIYVALERGLIRGLNE